MMRGGARTMWLTQPTLTTGDLASIRAPTLVLAGDEDAVSVDHTTSMAQSIRGAQLRIVPGGKNGLLSEQPVLELITKFLRG